MFPECSAHCEKLWVKANGIMMTSQITPKATGNHRYSLLLKRCHSKVVPKINNRKTELVNNKKFVNMKKLFWVRIGYIFANIVDHSWKPWVIPKAASQGNEGDMARRLGRIFKRMASPKIKKPRP